MFDYKVTKHLQISKTLQVQSHFSIGKLSSLQYLDVSDNHLDGNLPQNLENPINLEYVNIAYNLLEGVVSEDFFSNPMTLRVLKTSENKLKFEPNSNMIPPFEFQTIELSY
ncbi:hypothetical protein V6N13_005980 [Hibiscus sabdariffa]